MDKTFESEMPSWMHEMYSGNSKTEERPIFPDHIEQGLIPCRECPFEEQDNELLLEYDELAKQQLEIFFLHGGSQSDYLH